MNRPLSDLLRPLPLLRNLPAGTMVGAVDIGARRGSSTDLKPIAPWVGAIGFAPDADEGARLNRAAAGQSFWKEPRHVPAALGVPGDTPPRKPTSRGGAA